MKRQRVDGSTIAAVGYDKDTAVLEIEFTSGDLYEYFLVPRSICDGLLQASSKGRFFGEHIRDRYPLPAGVSRRIPCGPAWPANRMNCGRSWGIRLCPNARTLH